MVEEEAGKGVGTRGWMPPRQLAAVVPRGSRGVVGERGRGVGEGGIGAHRCVQGKGAALSTSAAARDAALGAVKPSRLRREHHQEGKDGEGGGIRLVVSRPGARRAPAASGSTEE